ncbi:transcriptional regulator [Desulfocucumis palustris]|uniref:Transcriptional regulator n=1 Tax=Desulfocucumis palustris TaxID=1898651 RepID=A0A2L2XGW9_9FIRM|nr:MarR family transcriptional regulator [Desulfocucumis palustris]GBF35607.1 transcriptional regulator [Desulfocucumis palustris]
MDIARDLFFAQQALVTLFSVTNKLQMQGDKYLQDLTLRQMLAVPAIIHAPDGNATINHIARKLGTTKQSAKQIVDAMEKKKYLSIAPNERDKRAVNVTITSEGEQAFRACSERVDEFLADIFHDFTTEDLETLWTLLQKLYRFDGMEQEGFEEHMNYNASEADNILQYHQNFLKRRTNNHG